MTPPAVGLIEQSRACEQFIRCHRNSAGNSRFTGVLPTTTRLLLFAAIGLDGIALGRGADGMGFYIRKTIKVGGINLNLSNSGLGVSTGVKGLRIGMNGRGTYVQMGRGGLYYRQQLSWSRPTKRASAPRVSPYRPPEPSPDTGIYYVEDLAQPLDIATATASKDEVLEHFRQPPNWIWAAVILAAIALIAAMSSVVWGIVWGVAAIGALVASILQSQRGVLVYDLEGEALERYQAFVENFGSFFKSQRMWLYETRSHTSDWKRNAGATALMKRRAATALQEGVPSIKTNLSIPCLVSGAERIHFLPDMIVVRQGAQVAGYLYSDLATRVGSEIFIEEEGVPSDAQVVGHTWKFVRKDGGPDRRFNNNRQIPKCRYQTFELALAGAFARTLSKSSEQDVRSLSLSFRRLAELLIEVREVRDVKLLPAPAAA